MVPAIRGSPGAELDSHVTVSLERTIRFFVNPRPERSPDASSGFAGKPGPDGLSRYYEIDTVCRGEPDPTTGYLVNIKTIDRAVRSAALAVLEPAARDRPETDPADLIGEIRDRAAAELARDSDAELVRLTWRLGPRHAWSTMTDHPKAVELRQRFDFAAAHRLHVPSLTDAENRATFGKCNNPSGHGHNYQVEPAVRVPVSCAFSQADLTRLTEQHVIDLFDHTHLNVDTPDFDPDTGVNPSVENIARVCFDKLKGPVADRGAELASVTVWETDRTSCTYPSP